MKYLDKFKILFALALTALLAFLAIYNQPYYPSTWFDEGLALQGAMNLALYGKYAMLSVEGFRVLDQPLVANGPGLVLPLSAVFSLFGIGLLQARFLSAVFFVACAWLFLRFTWRLYGVVPALLSLAVLLTIPLDGFIIYGRQALGNVPGLAYFFTGTLFFVKLCEKKSAGYAIVAGLSFGLALLTKGQYWLLIPVLGLVILADVCFYKQIGIRNGILLLATTLLCFMMWQIAQLVLVGADNYPAHLEAIRSSSKVTVFAFQAERYGQSFSYLLRSGFPIFILPGLLMAIWESRTRDWRGIVKFFLVVFVVVWLSWFVLASIGWQRYAFEAYAVGCVLSGYSILGLVNLFSIRGNQFSAPARFKILIRLSVGLLLAATIFFSALGFWMQMSLVFTYHNSSTFQMADYMKGNIPPNVTIESWEWEIDALAPSLTYHHPANVWVDRKTAETHFGSLPFGQYDPFEYQPAYLLDGPFSKFTNLYSAAIAAGCCTELYAVGEYTLYRVNHSQ
ncbi:MAG: glycosyltransferase family 39 protein [Anaerolineales bacterium]|nr:glycosyltransferase family 39 protein [Anaerolineales bacterium]